MIQIGHVRPLLLMLMLVLIATIPPSYAGAAAEKDRALLNRVQKLVDNTKTMEADFVQQVMGSGSDNQESRGHFSAAHPGRFRWDYQAPSEQLIVSDGNVVWYYEPDLKQATRSNVDHIRDTPAGFFTAGGPIDDSFAWEVATGTTWPGPALRLTPKRETSIREITVALHIAKDKILGLEVVDNLGTHSLIVFDNLVVNHPIPNERFNFSPPAGVDVVEDKNGGH